MGWRVQAVLAEGREQRGLFEQLLVDLHDRRDHRDPFCDLPTLQRKGAAHPKSQESKSVDFATGSAMRLSGPSLDPKRVKASPSDDQVVDHSVRTWLRDTGRM